MKIVLQLISISIFGQVLTLLCGSLMQQSDPTADLLVTVFNLLLSGVLGIVGLLVVGVVLILLIVNILVILYLMITGQRWD